MKFGIDRLLSSPSLRGPLEGITVSVEGRVTSSWGIPLVPVKVYKIDDGSGDFVTIAVFRGEQDFQNFADDEAEWIAANREVTATKPDLALQHLLVTRYSDEMSNGTLPESGFPDAWRAWLDLAVDMPAYATAWRDALAAGLVASAPTASTAVSTARSPTAADPRRPRAGRQAGRGHRSHLRCHPRPVP